MPERQPSVRSYAGSHLKAAGQALKSPVLGTLSKLAKGLPLVSGGLTYGSHVLDGESQQQAIGAGVGAGVGSAAGGVIVGGYGGAGGAGW